VELKEIQAIPKVLLHDHVDGGLRPQTIIELARSIDFPLPSYIDTQLQEIIFQSCNEGSLEKYLKNFDYTIAVMQSYENLMRVARECVEDLAADGIVYAEVRGAPELFTAQGLSIADVIEATLAGLEEGMSEVRHQGKAITVRFITCAMRHTERSFEVAKATLRYRHRGVVGFDIAGAERGFPAKNHIAAFNLLHENNFPYTIHAGEAAAVDSMVDAINTNEDSPILSDIAKMILDQQIHLEMAPTSNIQTGAVKSYSSHPAAILHSLGFNIALNTDNRLMSKTSLSNEYEVMSNTHGWTQEDIEIMNSRALKAIFDTEYAWTS